MTLTTTPTCSPASDLDGTLDRIPLLVDVDAHVVEPADVWSSRLPARYRDAGPRIELLPRGVPTLNGAAYIEAPGEDGPLAAWWHYEDHFAQIKRPIAAPVVSSVFDGIDQREGADSSVRATAAVSRERQSREGETYRPS